QTLYDYGEWANKKLFNVISQLTFFLLRGEARYVGVVAPSGKQGGGNYQFILFRNAIMCATWCFACHTQRAMYSSIETKPISGCLNFLVTSSSDNDRSNVVQRWC